MSTISTHVLDIALGRPAAGVEITLEREGEGGAWTPVGGGVTDDDGRVRELLAPGVALDEGIYRLSFALDDYFVKGGRASFYPEASIVFRVAATDEHYHVPLLLSPFGYSTYRGS